MTISTWNIEAITGYQPKTTFWMDFSIADRFGIKAIRDTYKRAFKEWHDDTVYVTELSLVLNWKAWEHENNPTLCSLYVDLWSKLNDWCYEHLTGDDLTYYFNTTD